MAVEHLLIGCVLKGLRTGSRYLVTNYNSTDRTFTAVIEETGELVSISKLAVEYNYSGDEKINKINLVDSNITVVNFAKRFYFFRGNNFGCGNSFIGSYTHEFLTKVDQLKSMSFCHSSNTKNVFATFSVDDKTLILSKADGLIIFDSLCFNVDSFRKITGFLTVCKFTLKTV